MAAKKITALVYFCFLNLLLRGQELSCAIFFYLLRVTRATKKCHLLLFSQNLAIDKKLVEALCHQGEEFIYMFESVL